MYLLCPPGHLEQSCNERYYFRHFIGVSGPSTEPIDTWTDKAMGLGDQPVTLSQMQAISANTSANISDRRHTDVTLTGNGFVDWSGGNGGVHCSYPGEPLTRSH